MLDAERIDIAALKNLALLRTTCWVVFSSTKIRLNRACQADASLVRL